MPDDKEQRSLQAMTAISAAVVLRFASMGSHIQGQIVSDAREHGFNAKLDVWF